MSHDNHLRNQSRSLLMGIVVGLGVCGWFVYDALTAQAAPTALEMRTEIRRDGLAGPDTVLEKAAIARACGDDPACRAGALLAHMLLAEMHVPGAPDAPASFDDLLIEPHVAHKVYLKRDRTPVPMMYPIALTLSAKTPEHGRIYIGRLTLFDSGTFRFAADWQIDGAAWPGDARDLSNGLLQRVRAVYGDYRASVNRKVAERDHFQRRKAEAIRRVLDAGPLER